MATLSEAPTAQSTQGGGELALGNGQPQDTARASQSPEESRNDEPVTASLSDASATAWRPADQNTTVAEQNTTVADQSTRQQTAGARGSAAEAQARRQAETTGETDDDPPGPPKDAGDLTSVGDGSGPWFDEGTNHREGGAVQQMTEGSCVSASGEMITDGRVTQPELLAELGDWSNLSALRDELNNRDGVGTWTGHYFADGSEALRQASEGPMAAQVQAPFGRAHMVMLEPGENGSFIVRDPYEGSSYDVDSSWVEKYVAGGVFR